MRAITFPWQYYDDQFADVDGVRVRYWDVGEGPQTVVLVHGFLCSVETWAHTIPPLAEHRRVIAVDVPGYGRSAAPKLPYSFDYYAEFLVDFLDHLRLEAPILVGHSMGGMIATLLAIRHPSRVERLVLVAPSVGQYLAAGFRLLTVPFLGEWLLKPPRGRDEVARSLNELAFDDYEWPEETLKRFFEIWSRKDSRDAALRLLRGYLRAFRFTTAWKRIETELNANLPAITHPTLLCWGTQDTTVSVEAAQLYREALPNLEYVEYDRCRHMPPIEHPGEFVERVEGFLGR